MGQRIDDAKIDFMYLRCEGLWATWLCAPFTTRHLNTVHAQLRKFGGCKLFGPAAWARARLWSITGGFETLTSTDLSGDLDVLRLLNFLTSFLRGMASSQEIPSFNSSSGRRDVIRTIQNLSINILFDCERRNQSWLAEPNSASTNNHQHIRDVLQHMAVSKDDAFESAELLHEHLLKVFDLVRKKVRGMTFPARILENIGTIDIKVGGVPFRNLDLAQILADLPRHETWTGIDSEFTRSEFFEWKRSAEEKRKKAGLRVASASIQEDEIVQSAGILPT